MNREAARWARELRRHDLVVELGDESFRLKKSFETATRVGAKFTLIVGENEVKADSFAVKNLETGEQVSVRRQELVARIQSDRRGSVGVSTAKDLCSFLLWSASSLL